MLLRRVRPKREMASRPTIGPRFSSKQRIIGEAFCIGELIQHANDAFSYMQTNGRTRAENMKERRKMSMYIFNTLITLRAYKESLAGFRYNYVFPVLVVKDNFWWPKPVKQIRDETSILIFAILWLQWNINVEFAWKPKNKPCTKR
jgi:hypothetical protein